jgi:hypothetical protein
MFCLKELKSEIEITEKTIECPIKDCDRRVNRIRKGQRLRNEAFKCDDHDIYISPSTFEYEYDYKNLFCYDESDRELLSKIKTKKRESRIARERSEDALTWNVFRFLENRNYIEPLFENLLNIHLREPEIIFWSYSHMEENVFNDLKLARCKFGEEEKYSTEPDLIIKDDNTLIFIEAKFTSNNNTSGDKERRIKRIKNPKQYVSGGEYWFNKVFNCNYEHIINSGKYELMRLWLLGSWIANGYRDFYLLNLTREKSEKDIEFKFKPLIHENSFRRFQRFTWEDIYDFVRGKNENLDKNFIKYFENKSSGYNRGKISKAFNR